MEQFIQELKDSGINLKDVEVIIRGKEINID